MSTVFQAPSGSPLRTGLAYAAMLFGAALLFLWIRGAGGSLVAPAPAGPVQFGSGGASVQGSEPLLHLLLALAVILVTSRALGALFKLFHQPPVIGEVVAGILLGPSLLGLVAPGLSQVLLPAAIAPSLGLLAQIGVILFMFLVGLELDTATLRHGTHATIAVSHSSIVVPFLLGSAMALFLYPRLSTSDVPFPVFALFMGISISVTAFPVLARILTDQGMQKTPLGVVALTCASIDDVTAWCLLAFVVGVVESEANGAALTVILTAAYVGFVLLAVRPLLARLVRSVERAGTVSQGVVAALVVGLLLSALVTEAIGIHALFGAFLFGAVVPHDSLVAREMARRLRDLVVILLLPAFFAFTGLRTQIGLVRGWEQWAICGLIVLVACLGKFGGTLAAARFTGLSWREGSALGILMNTRGLMELIVLNIGLDLKVLSPTLFAMLVIMAVVTTLMTTPILHLLLGRGERESGRPEDRQETAVA
jgi:Kef-type K+ transport system membrane component KefB